MNRQLSEIQEVKKVSRIKDTEIWQPELSFRLCMATINILCFCAKINILHMSKPGREAAIICTTVTSRTMGQSPWPVVRPVVF